MKKIIGLALSVSILFLTLSCTQYHAQGVGAGGAIGGIAGALLDKKNPWRGGVIGAVLGGLAGATITDISMRAAQEAAASGKLVRYENEQTGEWVEAVPVARNARTNCTKVQVRQWEEGKLISDGMKEECVGKKISREY